MSPVSHGRMRLVCLNISTAGRKPKPVTSEYEGTAAVPLDKEEHLALIHTPREGTGTCG